MVSDQGEVRVTSETGGQKGAKLSQMTLVSPFLRRQWIEAHDFSDERHKIALLAMLRFETGSADATILMQAHDALTELIADAAEGDSLDALWSMGEVYGFGSRKYSRTNYLSGYPWSLTQDAFWRHMLIAIHAERPLDDESGQLHELHALWHVTTQIIFAERNIGTDDRIWKREGPGYNAILA
jgi:hypothetical protein